MKLSRPERWMLANQYKILAALYPDEAESYKLARQVLEGGYEEEYDSICLVGDEPLSEEGCSEVRDILIMFDALKYIVETMPDRSGIEDWQYQFPGFDANNEKGYLSFATYLISKGDFSDLAPIKNSHAPFLSRYRQMYARWKERGATLRSSKDDVLYIISTDTSNED